MYECYDCGAKFEEPIVITEQLAGHPSNDVETCPDCGSDDIVLIDKENDDGRDNGTE